ncbi:MAG: hypothetical protein GX491_03640 [Chloroflexi bacterium]|nr:hypothetical protein [Chloroflexota bacterium]
MVDFLLKWNQPKTGIGFKDSKAQVISLSEMVKSLTNQHLELWWSCERSIPDFPITYTDQQQAANDKLLEKMVSGLLVELKQIPAAAAERERWQDRLRATALDFAKQTLNLEQRHLDFIESSGLINASQEFARMARRFDPQISGEDIFQATRNVMTANFMQLLLDLPVEVTPAVFAYSMLYPYTDNYLDDPAVPPATKLGFNHRFRARLQGETVRPANQHEAKINELVGMIEEQYDRASYPLVYESLLAIHAAQGTSLKLVAPGASPHELNVLGISFEKGGTSVLADGYLVAGWLSPAQAQLMFGYGAFTQLMDDLEDAVQDLREGRMSIFSQTAYHWPLDGITNQTFHFGRAIFSDLSGFQSPAVEPVKELITRMIDPILIDTIGQIGRFYSKKYLREIERHMPFHFRALKKQRDRLDRQKVTMDRLIDMFFLDQPPVQK